MNALLPILVISTVLMAVVAIVFFVMRRRKYDPTKGHAWKVGSSS